MSDEISKEFLEAFSTQCAGPFGECACGLIWYDTFNEYDEDHNDIVKANLNNRNTRLSVNGLVSYYKVGGEQYVMGCECNAGYKYEQFILKYEEQIAEYLRQRRLKLLDQAKKISLEVDEGHVV